MILPQGIEYRIIGIGSIVEDESQERCKGLLKSSKTDESFQGCSHLESRGFLHFFLTWRCKDNPNLGNLGISSSVIM